MYKKIFFVNTILIILFSFSLQAQDKTPEILFVISSIGDSIATSKILKNKSNEDQVVFIKDGKRKIFRANEVKSYYRKSRRISIYVSSANEHKLVKIMARGKVKLAQTVSSKRKEKFYLFLNDQWVNLDPYAYNLTEYLSKLLPDFKKSLQVKKVYYDVASLTNAIGQYNEYKDHSFKFSGSVSFPDQMKVGVFGSIGLSSLNANKNASEFIKTSIATNFGLVGHVQYSRLLSLHVQLGYVQGTWQNEDWNMKLRTLNITPLFDLQLYNNFNGFKLSASGGLKFNIDLASKITQVFGDDIEPTVGLAGLGLGYDFQLRSSLNRQLDFFVSYQIMTNHKIKRFETIISKELAKLKTNQVRIGALFYF